MSEKLKIGVIGAGTMGNGIAQVCATSGLQVTMVDVSEAALKRGMDAVSHSLDRLVTKNKLSHEGRNAALSNISVSLDYESFRESGLVIEAASESLDLKLKILQQAEKSAAEDAVLATNTSSISITQLAAILRRPERFVGMHFFNPVPIMSLLEIIRGVQTSDETHAKAEEFSAAIGKTPVNVRNSPGFVVNRILCPMINEAIFVLQEGLASAADIDSGMRLGCNHPIGPLALADMIGLDTMLSIMQVFYEGFGDPKYRPASLLKEMVAAGRLGRKTGKGFFSYADGGAVT